MSWTRAQALAAHREYQDATLHELAERYGVSHEFVRQQFLYWDLPRRSNSDKVLADRAQRERRAESERERIIALYKEHGTIDAVLAQVDLPRSLVTPIVNAIPNRESFRRRGTYQTYSREELISTLQQAAQYSGEPLTIPGYRKAAKALRLPSYDTHIRFFSLEEPDEPWLAALEAAGIAGNAARGRRANATTLEQCVAAVAQCIADNAGDRVSYDDYCKWDDGRDVPSGPTVRSIIPWNTAVELALDSLASV